MIALKSLYLGLLFPCVIVEERLLSGDLSYILTGFLSLLQMSKLILSLILRVLHNHSKLITHAQVEKGLL